MYKKLGVAILSIIMLIFLSTFVAALAEFSVTVSPTSTTVGWGEYKQYTVKIHCINSIRTCSCAGRLSTESSWDYFDVSAGADVYKYPSVQAPTSGKSSKSYKYYVSCNEWLDSTYVDEDVSFTLNYPTSSQWAEYQSATSSISTARSLISSAQSSIAEAQNKIREANNLGADIGTAQTYLNQANADKSSADSYLVSAESAYNSKNYGSATTTAQNAQNKANSAKSQANSAKSRVTQIIEEWNRKKNEASIKVTNARSEIDTAKQRVQDGEGMMNNATVLGLDTVSAKADMATARSKLTSAENYYAEASSAFDINNFEDAKSKSSLAITYANDAENLATNAYNSLSVAVGRAGEAAKAISSANTEISQMNEILTKMDYIIRSTEKRGIDLTATKNVVVDAKVSVDAAEDSLSEARNRIDAGSFEEAANVGIRARDKAASARNRLDTMTQTISVAVEEALDKAYDEIQSKMTSAEEEVKSAGETYGASAARIVNAQNALAGAKSSFSELRTSINSVKGAIDLMSLLDSTDKAFKEMDATETQTNLAIKEAKAAKLALVKKVATGAAAVAGAAGGGYLLLRRRKKKLMTGSTEEAVKSFESVMKKPISRAKKKKTVTRAKKKPGKK